VPASARPATYLATDLHDAEHLASAAFIPGRTGTAVLLTFRLLGCCYFAATLLLIEFDGSGLDAQFTPYFTNWTFVLLCAVELIGAALCVRQLVTTRPTAKHAGVRRKYDCLDTTFAVLMSTTASCAVLVTTFYWVVIYSPTVTVLHVDGVLRHGVNVLVFWGDVLLSRTPVCGYWFQGTIIYVSVYSVFMWAYHAASDTWTYEALDYADTRSTAYYVAVPILAFIGFVLTCVPAAVHASEYARAQA